MYLLFTLLSFLQQETVDDAHIKAINVLATKLERQNQEEVKTISQRKKQLNDKYVVCSIIMDKITHFYNLLCITYSI